MTLKYECENFDTILRSRDYVHVCFDQTDFVANKSHFEFEWIIRQVWATELGTFGTFIMVGGKLAATYQV